MKNLKTYKYDYDLKRIFKDTSITDSIPPLHSSLNQIGFKAQELLEHFPYLVRQDPKSGQYFINYLGLIPLLTESIKLQSKEIERLKDRLSSLEQK